MTIGADGRGSWTFQVKYPTGAATSSRVEDKSAERPDGGHAAGKIVYIDWPGWAGRGRDSGGADAMLELTAGKPKYAPGDKASVTFPSNEQGPGPRADRARRADPPRGVGRRPRRTRPPTSSR